MDAENAINLDVHRDLIHHDGKVDVLLGRQVRDLDGLRLILGVHDHIQRIGLAIQVDSGTLNLAIRRTLVKQLPGLTRAIHPIIHRKPTGLGKDQPLLFIVGNGDFTLLGRGSSSVLQRTHNCDRTRVSRDLTLQGLLNHELQNHGDRN